MREDDPTAEYAQMLHVEQQNHPSLHIVPAELPALTVTVKDVVSVVPQGTLFRGWKRRALIAV